MNLDHFFSRRYDPQNYNCAHFLCEVWKYITGQDIEKEMEGFLHPAGARSVPYSLKRFYTKLPAPKSPCVVLMFRKGFAPHVGMFYKRKVLHINRLGVQYQPVDVAAIGFNTIKYYAC